MTAPKTLDVPGIARLFGISEQAVNAYIVKYDDWPPLIGDGYPVDELTRWRIAHPPHGRRPVSYVAPGELEKASALLGLSPRTVRQYITQVWPNGIQEGLPFPQADERGKLSRMELLAWKAARPGRGRPGQERSDAAHPCADCGKLFPRRIKDKVTGDMLCKPDLLARDRERRAEADAKEEQAGARPVSVVPPR